MAKERNRQIFPPSIKSLNDVMKDIVEEFDVSEKFKLYVLSNSSGVNGAVSVIYEDIIREFGLYRWDDNAAKDSPKKENDHAMDDMRYFVSTILCSPNISRVAGFVER